MANTYAQHLAQLLTARDAITLAISENAGVVRYKIDDREVERTDPVKALQDIETLIVSYEKRVNSSNGPARNYANMRRWPK